MSTATTQGTNIEVLAPYLPYGIEIKCPHGYAELWGINKELRTGGGYAIQVEHLRPMSAEPDLDEIINVLSAKKYYSINECLPVLRPFSQLCDPLSDGTVPIIEMAKINWPHRNTVKATIHKAGEVHLWEKVDFRTNNNEGLARFIYLYESDFLHSLALSWKAADYLRRHHFAVGLEPHQYIHKTN